MWDRGQLKEQAKANLRATYLTALAVAFVAAILLGETSINSAGGVRLNFNIWEIRKFFNFDFYNFPRVNFPWFDYSWFDNSWFDFRWNIVLFSILSGLFVLFTGGIIAFAISIFVGAPITVGKSRFFIFNSSQPASFSGRYTLSFGACCL